MEGNKQIKDYLHLYLGCDVLVPKEQYWIDVASKRKYPNDGIEKLESVSFAGDGTITVSWPEAGFMILYPDDVKPILRPLSDMTEEESEFIAPAAWEGKPTIYVNAETTKYLLSKHFDLFGLHEAGLCLYKTYLK